MYNVVHTYVQITGQSRSHHQYPRLRNAFSSRNRRTSSLRVLTSALPSPSSPVKYSCKTSCISFRNPLRNRTRSKCRPTTSSLISCWNGNNASANSERSTDSAGFHCWDDLSGERMDGVDPKCRKGDNCMTLLDDGNGPCEAEGISRTAWMALSGGPSCSACTTRSSSASSPLTGEVAAR